MSLLCPTSPHRTVSSKDGRGWIFTEHATGVTLRSHSLDVLQGQIESHRFGVAPKVSVDLSHGWQMRFLDEICRQNPNAPCNPNPQDPLFEPPHVAIGRALWIELHRRAEEPVTDAQELKRWFETDWLNRVPQYVGCKCREHAILLLNQMQPRYDESFKQFCSDFHDAVSVRIGKKPWAQRQAELATLAEVPS